MLHFMRIRFISALAVVVSLALAEWSCSPTPVPNVPTPTGTPAPTLAVPATAEPTTAPTGTPAPTATPVPTATLFALGAACEAPNLATKKAGRLTLSTDNPAYAPWWGGDPATQYPNEPAGGDGWSVSDPYSGMGFEDATAYAVAAALGYTPDLIDWTPNMQFENAVKPGPKDYDFYMAQISIRPALARNVDFSDPYFDANQALISMSKAGDGSPNPILNVITVAGLKGFKLGAAVGTTSLDLIDNVIQPIVHPQVIDDEAAALRLLKNHQIDGLVTDLNTAFHMRDIQLVDANTLAPVATIVGQFNVSARLDQMGIVLQKGSPLTTCVDQALAQMKADGTLQGIYDTWIGINQNVPEFQ